MKNLIPILVFPLASVATTQAGAAELITATVQLLAQIVIAVVALVTLWNSRKKKK